MCVMRTVALAPELRACGFALHGDALLTRRIDLRDAGRPDVLRTRHATCNAFGQRAPLEELVKGPRMDIKTPHRFLVLIVDADMRSASLVGRLLRADGYEAEVTTDGAAALARLTRNPVPNAVVTDFHLAHADGLAVARYARSRRHLMHIFLVTGHPNATSTAADHLDEPLHVLTKPLDYADLLARLGSARGMPSGP